MDNKRKDHPDPKKQPKWNCLQQLWTHNVPADDEENTNTTNWEEIYYSLINRRLFPEKQKECCKGTIIH